VCDRRCRKGQGTSDSEPSVLSFLSLQPEPLLGQPTPIVSFRPSDLHAEIDSCFCFLLLSFADHSLSTTRYGDKKDLAVHTNAHLLDLDLKSDHPCPFVGTCPSLSFSPADLADHMIAVHHMRLAGTQPGGSGSRLTEGDMTLLTGNKAKKVKPAAKATAEEDEEEEEESVGESFLPLLFLFIRSLASPSRSVNQTLPLLLVSQRTTPSPLPPSARARVRRQLSPNPTLRQRGKERARSERRRRRLRVVRPRRLLRGRSPGPVSGLCL
jgi:hypothetical protein